MRKQRIFFLLVVVLMVKGVAHAGVPIEIPPQQLKVIQKSAIEQKRAMKQFENLSKKYNAELQDIAKEFSKAEPGSQERHKLALKLTDKYVDVLSKMVDPLVEIDGKFAAMQKAIEEAKKKAKPVKNSTSFEEQKQAFNEWLDVTQKWVDKGAFKHSRRIQKALRGIRARILMAKVHGAHFTDEDLDAIGENILTLRLELRNYAKAMQELLKSIMLARETKTRRQIQYDLDAVTELFDQGIVNQWVDIGPEVLDAIVEVPKDSGTKAKRASMEMEDVDLRNLRIH